MDACARSNDVLRRLLDAFPATEAEPYGEDLASRPVSVALCVGSVAEAREALPVWADITRCHVLWHHLKWPALPELGLEYEEYKYAECSERDVPRIGAVEAPYSSTGLRDTALRPCCACGFSDQAEVSPVGVDQRQQPFPPGPGEVQGWPGLVL